MRPLLWPQGFSKLTAEKLKVISSDIGAEMKREENDGALFVVPSQLNGAEYPSPQELAARQQKRLFRNVMQSEVYDVEDYKYDTTGGPFELILRDFEAI